MLGKMSGFVAVVRAYHVGETSNRSKLDTAQGTWRTRVFPLGIKSKFAPL